MSLLYCSAHERAFVQEHNHWTNLSLDHIHPLKRLYEMLQSADIEASDYQIVETPCDQCEAITHQHLPDHYGY